MRWLAYFILAYLMLGLQIGLGDSIAWHGARPNLVLIAALFVALNAPRDAALLGCFSLGLLQDLFTQQPPGLYALSYGMLAMLVGGTQQVAYKDHPLAHFGLALLGGGIAAGVLAVHGFLRPPGSKLVVDGTVVASAMRVRTLSLFIGAAYTALLAPAVLWFLNRFKKSFAFQGTYRRRWR